MTLKEKVERFMMFPFSVGCVSQSSVRVVEKQCNKQFGSQDEERTEQSDRTTKSFSSSSFIQLPMPNLSSGIHKLAKRFKNISNLFSIYKNNEEEDDVEMEIGYPTDVRHVSHIGWDGFNNEGEILNKKWEKGEEFFPISSLSLKEFELNMDPQERRDSL